MKSGYGWPGKKTTWDKAEIENQMGIMSTVHYFWPGLVTCGFIPHTSVKTVSRILNQLHTHPKSDFHTLFTDQFSLTITI